MDLAGPSDQICVMRRAVGRTVLVSLVHSGWARKAPPFSLWSAGGSLTGCRNYFVFFLFLRGCSADESLIDMVSGAL